MKRVLLILIISLLFVSGWGVVFADTLCPHKQARRAHERIETVAQHREGSSCHEEMASDEAEAIEPPDAEEEAQRASFEGQTGPCTHCITNPETPANLLVFTRVAELSKRDAGVPVLPPSGFLSSFATSFAPPVQARQHAPPGTLSRRHLLLNVFLI
ncbi:MAG: hypothetical protein H7Y30_02200 [Pyrinomonadaceae bacterium]|nr:hypothetical protein [Pyrinomonadaceae bacterium]